MTDLPLTPATALLLANFVQDRIPQASATEDGVIVPAAVPILSELQETYGVRDATCEAPKRALW